VIKTYVRLGLGIGIIADQALEQEDVETLATIDASHLFPDHTTWIGFRRGALLVRYANDFLQLLAPHLTGHLLTQARFGDTQDEV
ncbi:CysB family transcriptional regulator, partial [Acinetobacter baumannii]